jgi:hypothetical protein
MSMVKKVASFTTTRTIPSRHGDAFTPDRVEVVFKHTVTRGWVADSIHVSGLVSSGDALTCKAWKSWHAKRENQAGHREAPEWILRMVDQLRPVSK